jgi:hypothetical protein
LAASPLEPSPRAYGKTTAAFPAPTSSNEQPNRQVTLLSASFSTALRPAHEPVTLKIEVGETLWAI